MRSSVRRLTGSGIDVPPRSGVKTQPLVRGISDLTARARRSPMMHAELDILPSGTFGLTDGLRRLVRQGTRWGARSLAGPAPLGHERSQAPTCPMRQRAQLQPSHG